MKHFIHIFFILLFTIPFCYSQRIAITFDDAPRNSGEYFSGIERTEILMRKLDSLNIQAAFFCNTIRFDSSGLQRIKMYDNAGHIVGNHTHSHSRYSTIGMDNYINGILTTDSIISSFTNYRKWFRYPFLDEGKTIEERNKIREALKAYDYFSAYVTVDNYDWYIEAIFQKALKENKTIDFNKLREFYINHIYNSILFYDKVSRETLGRPADHILLLHENDLAALFITDLVSHLRQNDWEIISPEEAYKDGIAQIIPDVLFNNQGRIAAIAYSSGKKPRELVQESEDEEYLEKEAERLKIFR